MSRAARPTIVLSAGEASGDRLGAGLAKALLARRPDLRLMGMGGAEMAAAGVEILQDANEVAVVGFSEVLSHLSALRLAMRRLARCLEGGRPDLLVPIDFPEFNLMLAGRARRASVPVVYFVSPQIWAWRRGRVHKVRRLVRRMLVLFPFEVSFYSEAGVPVTFVGHPVVEKATAAADTAELARRAGFDPGQTVVALLPGSRRSEVERILPVMLEAALLLRRERPGLGFLLPLAPGLDRAVVDRHVEAAGLDGLRVHAGDFPDILRVCAAGAVASGTASLESAIVGLPMVVVYRVAPLSYWIGRALVRVEHIALPNLVARRRVVPELVQADCTPARIAAEIERYLAAPAEASRVRAELGGIRRELGRPGVFERAAEAVLAELDAVRGAPPAIIPDLR
ncbi:MAG TPA: lipid-A-disaccharide synthase [Planctomycetota bacterium]|nr:lipid-A-disaccharide synthase [Planctomycetota bacterium]